MHPFQIIALTPAGVADARLVLAADRAGCLGIINAEIGALPYAVLDKLRGRTRAPFGLKLAAIDDEILSGLEGYVPAGLGWLVVDASIVLARPELLQRMAGLGLRVIVEVTEWDDRLAALSDHHALQVKGHEAGGLVGEETSFVLLQKALACQSAPVFVRGGVGLHGTAAVRAAGAAGVVLDDQLLLLKELPVSGGLQAPLRDFAGLETGLISVGEKQWRVFDKPGFRHLRQMRQTLSVTSSEEGQSAWSALSAGTTRARQTSAARPGGGLCEAVRRPLFDLWSAWLMVCWQKATGASPLRLRSIRSGPDTALPRATGPRFQSSRVR